MFQYVFPVLPKHVPNNLTQTVHSPPEQPPRKTLKLPICQTDARTIFVSHALLQSDNLPLLSCQWLQIHKT